MIDPYELQAATPTEEMLEQAITDAFGAKYSPDGKVLYEGPEKEVDCFKVKDGTEIIASYAFHCAVDVNKVVLPTSVVAIGKYAFCRSDVKEVALNEGLRSIGETCFHSCQFTTFHIPDTVVYVGEWAFEDCRSLETLHLSTLLTSLERGLFSGCCNLKEVNLHAGLQLLGAECFQGCCKLTSVHVPEGVETIEFLTFDGCATLTDLVLPDSLKSIGDSAFAYCNKLSPVIIPEKVEKLGTNPYGGTTISEVDCKSPYFTFRNHCLYEGTKLIAYMRFDHKKVVVEDGVETIGGEAFCEHAEIEEIILPDSVHTICSNAFMNMDSLVTIRMSENIKHVERHAFNGCRQLKPFILPPNVSEKGTRLFWYCNGPQLNLRMLLDAIEFDVVAPVLKKEYNCTDEQMLFFHKAYNKLKFDTVAEPYNSSSCVIQLCRWSRDNPVVRVVNCSDHTWEQTLLREIVVRKELDLTDEEILAHILWEATYYWDAR